MGALERHAWASVFAGRPCEGPSPWRGRSCHGMQQIRITVISEVLGPDEVTRLTEAFRNFQCATACSGAGSKRLLV